ncbi:MAG: hypothetical protein ACPGO3_09495 [Magnetospiraceae bacterium]
MSHIVDYHVNAGGQVLIQLEDGSTRMATDREWLYLFKNAPMMTLALASRKVAIH